MNMFIQLTLIPLLLFQSLHISANTYDASCSGDSNCDQHQKCVDHICQCDIGERRFWTGEICAVCVQGFRVTKDRCYQSFNELKTWAAARAYCRDRYADLFTWRNNRDEQFIRPIIESWAASSRFRRYAIVLEPNHLYRAWSGATITSLNPHTTKWVDPDGIKLDSDSDEWCDPTKHTGYDPRKEPTSESRQVLNTTEREECVTYISGSSHTSLLCLADDYCSEKYAFICDMNTASMNLANSVLHGGNGETINFEQPPPPPPSPPSPTDSGNGNLSPESGIGLGNGNSPSALSEKSGSSSMTNIVIFIGVGIILIVGAVAGYMFIKKKKGTTGGRTNKNEDVSQVRPSFTSSLGSMLEE